MSSRAHRSVVVPLLVTLSLHVVAPHAFAQDKSKDADKLFHEGTSLFAEGKTAEACRKLEASQALDPSPGTLFNMAICHHAEGKLGTAQGEFEQSLALSIEKKRKDREKTCREHLAQLETQVTRVTISVPAPSRIAGLMVTWDGAAFDDAMFGKEIARDPGEHVIAATAPGHQPFEAKVTIGATAEKKSIEIPLLREVEKPKPTPIVAIAPKVETPEKPVSNDVPSSGATQRTLGFIVGGAGVVAVGVGFLFLTQRNSAVDRLTAVSQPDPNCTAGDCEATRQASYDGAKSDVSSAQTKMGIAFAAGGALVATGVILLLTAPRGEKRATEGAAMRFAPLVGEHGGGFVLGGAF